MSILEAVSALYEARPYPPVGRFRSLFQGLRQNDFPLLNYRAAYACAYGTTAGAVPNPRILVAGCGTFEPVVVALANPTAQVVAMDLSARSLRELAWQAKWRGLSRRIETRQGDFQALAGAERFDYLVATGVMHHLEKPLAGFRALASLGNERAVFRFMVYSKWGRSLLYQTKQLARALGLREPAEVRRMVEALPPDHPYKIYFHLYGDTRTDTGLADGYLHPCDQPFTALELGKTLANAGLRATRFLHRPEGQPEALKELTEVGAARDVWEKLALLECYGALEENFCFFAARANGLTARPSSWEWNETLPAKGKFHSRILGRELAFRRSREPSTLPNEEREALARALFLLPAGGAT